VKELTGSAESTVEASPEACFELVAGIEGYPGWNGEVIREVELLEADSDGRPTRVRTTVHVAAGPITRDFHLVMDVQYDDHDAVCLSRMPNAPSDPEKFEVVWRVAAEPPTRVAIELNATLEVPRFAPLGGVGDRIAQGFVDAARRELEGSSPNTSASSS
jgi:hypothetical protein